MRIMLEHIFGIPRLLLLEMNMGNKLKSRISVQEEYFRLSERLPIDESPESEIDHDVLFRAGKNLWGSETYTPRLVSINLKGSLGTLNKLSDFYNPETKIDSFTWSGNVERYDSDPIQKNNFLKALDDEFNNENIDDHRTTSNNDHPPIYKSYSEEIEKSVHYWSDFNKTGYHSKSLVEIPNYKHSLVESDTLGDFEGGEFMLFNQGEELMDEPEFDSDVMEDRIRYFAEECNSLQGINIFSDISNGFSGLTSKIVESFYDDNPKATLTVYGLWGFQAPFDENGKSKLGKLTQHKSLMYIPLFNVTEGKLNLTKNTAYHTSAYLAAAIETITIPMRLKKNPLYMYDINGSVIGGRTSANVIAMSAAVPFPVTSDTDPISSKEIFLARALQSDKKIPWIKDLTFGTNFEQIDAENSHYDVLRGVVDVLSSSKKRQNLLSLRLPSHISDKFDDLLLSYGVPIEFCTRIMPKLSFPVSNSFPQFFKNCSIDGIHTNTRNEPKVDIEKIAVLSRLRSTSRISQLINTYSQYLREMGPRAALYFSKGDHGKSADDFKCVLNDLLELQTAYDEI
ncbi:Protein misato 1 [Nowakowskiella sp. JEL0078]|nr:Protein misato 1 [Nowakowskiella sp. JEL0078]